mgnify:CR=1 FL=1
MLRNGKEYVSLLELLEAYFAPPTQHAARLRLYRAGLKRKHGQWRWLKGSRELKRAEKAIFGG